MYLISVLSKKSDLVKTHPFEIWVSLTIQATSGDKEEHNQRRKHELCEYGTSREIFSENFDGTTQLRNGQTPVDGNKGDLDEEIMEDEGRRMKRKARERERERGVELFIISLFRCKQCKCERREMNNFFISETKHISIIVFFIEKNIFAVIYQYRGKSAIKKNTSSKKINLHPCKLRGYVCTGSAISFFKMQSFGK